MEKTIGYDEGGYYVTVYDQDSDRMGKWYGTLRECLDLDPSIVRFDPVFVLE